MVEMDGNTIRHRPKHFDHTLFRRVEIEREILHCPDGCDDIHAQCPECGCTMCYRGVGRLRNGKTVHYFECVHSYREVHSVSIVINE